MNPLLQSLRAELKVVAVAEHAGPMAAYVKTTQPFLGVKATPRRAIVRALAKAHKPRSREEYEAQVAGLWAGEYREEQYAALDWAMRFKPFIVSASLPLYERLIQQGQWWDTVDLIAIHLVGGVEDPDALLPLLDSWIDDDNMWVRRSAIIAQNNRKDRTDWARLQRYCLQHCGDKEFFIRKAIGWALRDHSRINAQGVADFITEHKGKLSGLSYREAAKGVTREGISV